ncbi:hypothetical protein ACFL9U_04295 [Thermodesulfobacteriota bacterium]
MKTNPIHGEDLAVACVDAIEIQDKEVRIGGPEILSYHEIAETAFTVLGTRPKITYIPNWIRIAILRLTHFFTGSRTYGPIEFFLTVMAMNMVAPRYGKHTLKAYFKDLKQTDA